MSERLLRISEVMERVGLRRTAIYDKISRDEFPHPIKLGNVSRWVETEVDAWIAEAIASHRQTG
ncbi:AlpA family transcriptional regulator [Marinobacter sp. MDS2]|uniref:helix-turn-helix transcriptional regulator n=1 Tax=Marinobacter sp. MDS2 TaxID=3065961 RepID=UPI00273B39E8|nr:AlpA family phage regulatory protein [Marinobacter sp. MDS2]MDP4546534.1 AlpA family phage regulatory protein [Marinobacter sp. MDS2]